MQNAYWCSETDDGGVPDVWIPSEAPDMAEWGTQSQSPSETYTTSQSGADTDAQAHMEAEAFLQGLLRE